MAKTMYTIEMEFQNARKQAEELEQIAKNLSMLADSSFQSCLAGIAANWKGENAAVFCRKGAIVGRQIKNSALDIKNAAETIRQTAQNTYDAEKKNCETAQQRLI